MNQQNRNARPALPLGSIMMRAAGVLLCLVLFSVHLMGGLYARYSSGNFAEDEARVAKFDVNVVGAPADALDVSCRATGNHSDTYTITVTNKSEVAVEYAIAVTVKEKADQSELKGVTPQLDVADGTLAAGAEPVISILRFAVDWNAFVGADPVGTSKSIDATFTVTVTVEQVD